MVVNYHSLQEAWEDGLKAVEEAMWMMPKSMQRNLARYKLIFKSRLSRSIESDMIWFQVSIKIIDAKYMKELPRQWPVVWF